MPILDGIQATSAIPGLEKDSGICVPLVALTAHSLPEDHEACLATGMDAYLPKPVDASMPLKTIEQLNQSQTHEIIFRASCVTQSGIWRLGTEGTSSQLSDSEHKMKASGIPELDVWYPSVALRRMGGDAELLSSMVEYFLEDSPALLLTLKERIDASDVAEACRIAHSLKGLCANFEAETVTRFGALIEAACASGKFDEASALIPPLTEQLRLLVLALTAWKEASSQPAV